MNSGELVPASSDSPSAPPDSLEGFVAAFVEPLLFGGSVCVRLPLRRDVFEALIADANTTEDLLARPGLLLQAKARELLTDPPLLAFGEDGMRLLVATHQLLYGFHAAVEREQVRARYLEILRDDTLAVLSAVPLAAVERSDRVARHLLIDPLFDVFRRDARVAFRFKFGELSFFGEHARWWKGMPWRRNVEHDQWAIDPVRHASVRPCGAIFDALLARSPLTRWLRADVLHDRLVFDSDVLAVIDDPKLCRLIVNTYVSEGLGAFLPALGCGFRMMLSDPDCAHSQIIKMGRLLVTLALSDAAWTPQQSARRLLDAKPRAPKGAGAGLKSPETLGGDSDGDEAALVARERDNQSAWAAITQLIERPDILALPEPDQRFVDALRDGVLARIQPSIERAQGPMIALIEERFPKPPRAS